ncbi:5'-methylthioadenosine/S-adenosylhomocysteine nucleosidase family protein [Pedobacter panaciterrae]
MISEYTNIPRTIDELTRFLEGNQNQYQSAYENIRSDKGWTVPFAAKYFDVMDSLYNRLYINLYERLLDDHNLPDSEIIDSVKSFIKWADKETKELDILAAAADLGVLTSIDGHVYQLLYTAFNKLKQLLQVSDEEKKLNKTYKISQKNAKSRAKIGIVTVTDEEHTAALAILSDVKIVPANDSNAFTYRKGFIKSKSRKISVVLVQCLHQGAAASAVATTQLIINFSPEIIVMLGHAAGNKGKMKSCGIGDIMIAADAIDYEKNNNRKKADNCPPEIVESSKIRPIAANATLVNLALQFKEDKNVLEQIKENYPDKEKFSPLLRVFSGAIISGSVLVRSSFWFDKVIKDYPGAIGLDMEIYGFYYAAENTTFGNKPKCIAIKSISDYGSHDTKYPQELKAHTVRVPYACYTSAEFFKQFALANII